MFVHYVIQGFFLVTGAIALLAALSNWDWFFCSQNAAPIVRRLGRNRSRWFYGFLGILFIATAAYFFGVISSL